MRLNEANNNSPRSSNHLSSYCCSDLLPGSICAAESLVMVCRGSLPFASAKNGRLFRIQRCANRSIKVNQYQRGKRAALGDVGWHGIRLVVYSWYSLLLAMTASKNWPIGGIRVGLAVILPQKGDWYSEPSPSLRHI